MATSWNFWQITEGGTAEATDYEDYNVEELKAELESRGLPKSGKKDELVARLVADDG